MTEERKERGKEKTDKLMLELVQAQIKDIENRLGVLESALIKAGWVPKREPKD